MVVGDDHVHADFPGMGGLLHGGDAAVHRDDQRHAPGLERIQRQAVEPVALLIPVGDIVIAGETPAAQPVRQHTGGGDAVHVIVAVDRHGLLPLNGAQNPLPRLVHAEHEHRIAEGFLPAIQETPGLFRAVDPAQRENLAQKR